jgi:hypothetical protein
MPTLSLSFPDLVTILHACGAVRPLDCTPNHLQGLLAARLDVTNPALAARVRQYDRAQMLALCEYVLEGLTLAADPKAGP